MYIFKLNNRDLRIFKAFNVLMYKWTMKKATLIEQTQNTFRFKSRSKLSFQVSAIYESPILIQRRFVINETSC